MLLTTDNLNKFLNLRVSHSYMERGFAEKLNELLYNYFATGANEFTNEILQELLLHREFNHNMHIELAEFINSVIPELPKTDKEDELKWPNGAKFAWKRDNGKYDYFLKHPVNNVNEYIHTRGRTYIGEIIERYPEIDWPEDERYLWFAYDKSGRGYFYTERPEVRQRTEQWSVASGSWTKSKLRVEPFGDDDRWARQVYIRPNSVV